MAEGSSHTCSAFGTSHSWQDHTRSKLLGSVLKQWPFCCFYSHCFIIFIAAVLSIDLNPGSCWISQENVEDDHAADSQQDHEGQNDDEGQRNKEKKNRMWLLRLLVPWEDGLSIRILSGNWWKGWWILAAIAGVLSQTARSFAVHCALGWFVPWGFGANMCKFANHAFHNHSGWFRCMPPGAFMLYYTVGHWMPLICIDLFQQQPPVEMPADRQHSPVQREPNTTIYSNLGSSPLAKTI